MLHGFGIGFSFFSCFRMYIYMSISIFLAFSCVCRSRLSVALFLPPTYNSTLQVGTYMHRDICE